MTNEIYWNIRNRALSIYSDTSRSEGAQYNDMQRYLESEVEAGRITPIVKCKIAADVIREFLMEV